MFDLLSPFNYPFSCLISFISSAPIVLTKTSSLITTPDNTKILLTKLTSSDSWSSKLVEVEELYNDDLVVTPDVELVELTVVKPQVTSAGVLI